MSARAAAKKKAHARAHPARHARAGAKTRWPAQPARLETERLILRPLRAADANDIFEYASDLEVTRHVRFVTHKSIRDTRAFLALARKRARKRETLVWGIELKRTQKLIGSAGFVAIAHQHRRAELGYALNRKFWGQGIASEAAAAIVAHGFRALGLNRIEAHVSPSHPASARVLEKCGFAAEGILRQHEWIKGHWHDSKIYALLRSGR